MARRSGASLRVPAAGSPRGCVPHRTSQPWAGGVPGRGLSRRPQPPWCQAGAPGVGGVGGGGRGGGAASSSVLVVLIAIKLHGKVEIAWLGLRTVTLPRQVPRGRLLHGEEAVQGRARPERQQGPITERLQGEPREQCPARCRRGRDHLEDSNPQGR